MDKNKAKLTFLLLIAALPITLATWFYGVSQQQQEGTRSTTNNGKLIIPVMDITEFNLRDDNNESLFVSFEEMIDQIDEENYEPRQWMLLFLGSQTCDETCADRLYFLRQLHRRLSGEEDRVARYYVNVSSQQLALDERTEAMFKEAFSEMTVVHSDEQELRNNLQRTHVEEADPINSHYIYVVDPVGNVMLYFNEENTTEEIFKDLDKLLEQSSLG